MRIFSSISERTITASSCASCGQVGTRSSKACSRLFMAGILTQAELHSSLLPRCRWRLGVVLARELAQQGLEILGLTEVAVDRGETHVGDVVERAQRLHHQFANGLGRHLALALAL